MRISSMVPVPMKKHVGPFLLRVGARLERVGSRLAVPSKAELRMLQRQVCREYVQAHSELAHMMPVQQTMQHSVLMGDKAVEADSRSVDLLRMRFVRTIEFAMEVTGDITSPEVTILDAGAADGLYLRALGKQGAGLSIDQQCVDQMRADGFHAEQGSIYQMPFQTKQFDYSLCLEVLEHLQSPIGALHELRRVTRRALIVSIPHVGRTRVRSFGYWEQEDSTKTSTELRAEAHHVSSQ